MHHHQHGSCRAVPNVFRVGHPLAQRLTDLARTADTPSSEVVFQYTGSGKNIAVLQPLVGSSGWLDATVAKDLANGLSDAERPIVEELNARNGRWFDREIEKLERWTGDRRDGLKGSLDDLDARIKEAKKAARFARSLQKLLDDRGSKCGLSPSWPATISGSSR